MQNTKGFYMSCYRKTEMGSMISNRFGMYTREGAIARTAKILAYYKAAPLTQDEMWAMQYPTTQTVNIVRHGEFTDDITFLQVTANFYEQWEKGEVGLIFALLLAILLIVVLYILFGPQLMAMWDAHVSGLAASHAQTTPVEGLVKFFELAR